MNNTTSYNEQELLQQLKDGSENAFIQIFHHYGGTVHAVAFRFLKSPALAEEIVQDVFRNLWHNGANADYINRLEPYLFTLATNFIFEKIRKISSGTTVQPSLPNNETPCQPVP